jgi:hypothetical protein
MQVMSDIDTSKVIVNDAEQFFNDLRTRTVQDSVKAATRMRLRMNRG